MYLRCQHSHVRSVPRLYSFIKKLLERHQPLKRAGPYESRELGRPSSQVRWTASGLTGSQRIMGREIISLQVSQSGTIMLWLIITY